VPGHIVIVLNDLIVAGSTAKFFAPQNLIAVPGMIKQDTAPILYRALEQLLIVALR
jgi:hypothetical protein